MITVFTATLDLVEDDYTLDIAGDEALSLGMDMAVQIVDPDTDYYTGEYTITPLADESQTLDTAGKMMIDDLTVLQVPYYQTSNVSGDTVYIASEV